MRNPAEFDAFYKDARSRLLLQTYALTGDLSASRSAVRDSFVVAWHHWRKISRLDDPEDWARPRAWSHAQRRHTTRLWHRDKGLDPEIKATLDALAKLPVPQRKVLLLTQLTTISLAQMAREVGLPRDVAERELQAGSAQFGVHRNVPTTGFRALFEPIRELVEAAQWPRSTIIRRAGAARRRTHTAVGAAAAVGALVLSGSLVTSAGGVHPSLSREELAGVEVPTPRASTSAGATAAAPELTADALLGPDALGELVGSKRWHDEGTDDNMQGDGLVLPCQTARYADPRGTAALVRHFTSASTRTQPRASVIQSTEVSRTEKRAGRTYRATLDWYAGCTDARVQLLSTQRVDAVGDEAMLLVLRSWERPVATLVAGVARTGRVTTTTVQHIRGDARPAVRSSADLLGAAVDGLCVLPSAGSCSAEPRLVRVDPVPAGPAPGMLSVVDLPPVRRVSLPWVATEPRKAMINAASTRCDETTFTGRRISHNITRSFLVPGADLPDSFGLTETVGSLPAPRARAFVSGVRDRMSSCSDKDLGTTVSQVARRSAGGTELAVWRVSTELSDRDSVEYFMGILRRGTSVAQVGFIPDGRSTLAPGAFLDLVERALARLASMPPPE